MPDPRDGHRSMESSTGGRFSFPPRRPGTWIPLTILFAGFALCVQLSRVGYVYPLARLTPHGWAMQGVQDVLVRGAGLAGALFFLVGAWRFRFDC